MRRCVWSRNLKNEEATDRVGPQRHRKQNNTLFLTTLSLRPSLNVSDQVSHPYEGIGKITGNVT